MQIAYSTELTPGQVITRDEMKKSESRILLNKKFDVDSEC